MNDSMIVHSKQELAAAIGAMSDTDGETLIEWHRSTGVTLYRFNPARVREARLQKYPRGAGIAVDYWMDRRYDAMQRRVRALRKAACI